MLERLLACAPACIFHSWLRTYALHNRDSVSTQGQRSFLHIWLRPTESLPPGGWLPALWHLEMGRKCLDSPQNDFYLWMLFQFHQDLHTMSWMTCPNLLWMRMTDGENRLWPLKIGHVLWGKSLGTERYCSESPEMAWNMEVTYIGALEMKTSCPNYEFIKAMKTAFKFLFLFF